MFYYKLFPEDFLIMSSKKKKSPMLFFPRIMKTLKPSNIKNFKLCNSILLQQLCNSFATELWRNWLDVHFWVGWGGSVTKIVPHFAPGNIFFFFFPQPDWDSVKKVFDAVEGFQPFDSCVRCPKPACDWIFIPSFFFITVQIFQSCTCLHPLEVTLKLNVDEPSALGEKYSIFVEFHIEFSLFAPVLKWKMFIVSTLVLWID